MDRLAVGAPRVAGAIAEFVYGALVREPYRVGKPLRFDLAGQYSARRGEYRVIYRVDDSSAEVVILRVAARRAIYRSE